MICGWELFTKVTIVSSLTLIGLMKVKIKRSYIVMQHHVIKGACELVIATFSLSQHTTMFCAHRSCGRRDETFLVSRDII